MKTKSERMQEFTHEYAKKAPKSFCSCGHTGDGANSEHKDTVQAGHGACAASDCDCKKFSWAKYTDMFQRALLVVGGDKS